MKSSNKPKYSKAKEATKIVTIQILILLIIIGIIYLCVYCSKIHNEETHNDIENYYNYMYSIREEEKAYTTLAVFPPLLNEIEANVIKFEYKKANTVLDDLYFLYLECTYNEKNYNRELERVDKLIARKWILETNDKYDIYITRNTGYNTFEYALFDKENLKVIYVFNQVYKNKDLQDIKKEYKLF